MQIIYLDTLFLLNAMVDYLLLLASARVAGEPLARLRFFLAALLGGAYAVAILLLPLLEKPWFKLLIYILLILVAYGKSKRLLRQGLIFLALSAAFAGGILAITLFGGQGLLLDGGVLYSSMDLKIVLLSAALCYMIFSILFRNFGKHSHLAGELQSIILKLSDKEIHLTALVDTGNTLQDSVTGQNILVVEGELLSPFFKNKIKASQLLQPTIFLEECKEHKTRLRLIPYQVVGMQGLLLVMRVDEITVNGKGIAENLVALSPTAISDGGSYQALISYF